MTTTIARDAISPLRRRMLEDMSVRKFSEKTGPASETRHSTG